MIKYNEKYTAQQLANELGLNVDTVRKRAKAGKIKGYQDKNGRWTFLGSDLLSGTAVGKPLVTVEKKLTDVIFVLDRSGSMAHYMTQARQNLQSQIDLLKTASDSTNEYRATVINFDNMIVKTAEAQNVLSMYNTDHLYLNPNGMTRLNDAIVEAINTAKNLDTGGKQHAFLISVVTDGAENASGAHVTSVASAVRSCIALDRYTFAYAGPAGSEYHAASLGIPEGNVTSWEQSVRGTQFLGTVSNTSLNRYTRLRGIGSTNSTSFYAAPVTKAADKFASQLDNALDDVSHRVKVERVNATDPVVINKFCDRKFGSFPKGQIYYQLTESEKVQDYKKLIVQDTTTGNFYTGDTAAKKLLGVPKFQGTVNIKPGDLGEFKVFVQSTSYNRKLTPGTAVVYLP